MMDTVSGRMPLRVTALVGKPEPASRLGPSGRVSTIAGHPKQGWANHSLSIASDEIDDLREHLERAMGFAEDLAHQVEAADKSFEAADAPHEVAYVQFSECGEHIRKWARSPFEGGRKCRIEIGHAA